MSLLAVLLSSLESALSLERSNGTPLKMPENCYLLFCFVFFQMPLSNHKIADVLLIKIMINNYRPLTSFASLY